ncbi:MAG: DUF7388 family protein [Candidatus Hodarchaeales archaeon]
MKHHSYVFLDYEGESLLWRPNEIEKILLNRNGQHGTLIITLAARAREFSYNPNLLSKYALLAEKYSQLGICVVAGHPAYSSVDGSRSSQMCLLRMTRTLREITSAPLFLGTEKLPSNYAAALAKKYSLIPFWLKSESLPRDIAGYQTTLPNNGPCAVYSPIALVDDASIILKKLIGYILRRDTTIRQLRRNDIQPEEVKGVLEGGGTLSNAVESLLCSRLRELAIFGSSITQQLHQLCHWGASIIVGFPCLQENIFDTISRFGASYESQLESSQS